MGNPILGNDSLGLYVARRLKEALKGKNVEVVEVWQNHFSVVDKMAKSERVIVVDALKLPELEEGEIVKLPLDEFPSDLVTPHGFSLVDAVRAYEVVYSVNISRKVVVYGVNIKGEDFGEGLSEEVKAKADALVAEVLEEVRTLGAC